MRAKELTTLCELRSWGKSKSTASKEKSEPKSKKSKLVIVWNKPDEWGDETVAFPIVDPKTLEEISVLTLTLTKDELTIFINQSRFYILNVFNQNMNTLKKIILTSLKEYITGTDPEIERDASRFLNLNVVSYITDKEFDNIFQIIMKYAGNLNFT